MFIQVITGKVEDAEGFKRQTDRWKDELRPDAKGFLGSTSGTTSDGRFITIARFENEELARQNSDDDRQSAWYAEFEKTVSDVRFLDLIDADEWKGGGSNDAGFVQVMVGKVKDVSKAKELDKKMGESMPDDWRPDLIGGTAGYTSSGEFANTMYFTTEAEAREGEKKMTAEMENMPEMAEWGQIMDGEIEYFDLNEPEYI
jgi:hypothetical protein